MNELLNIVEGMGVQLKRSGIGYRGKCPIHGGSNSTAFSIYKINGKWFYKCFSCGASGDTIKFVMETKGVSYQEALRLLGKENIKFEPIKHVVEEQKRKIEKTRRALTLLRKARKDLIYYRNLYKYDKFRIWVNRGIEPENIKRLRLGYNPQFQYITNDERHTGETITIPVYDEYGRLLTIRHRILEPVNPKDKYRPETAGLGAHEYMYYPYFGLDTGENVLVVEGEIKAIVTGQTLNSRAWQVIGLPGKTQWKQIVDKLQGKQVWIIPDPDGITEAIKFATTLGGAKIIYLRDKVDDFIINRNVGTEWLREKIRTAELVR